MHCVINVIKKKGTSIEARGTHSKIGRIIKNYLGFSYLNFLIKKLDDTFDTIDISQAYIYQCNFLQIILLQLNHCFQQTDFF